MHEKDLVGIANWVEATGPKTPMGYAKIAYHFKWIEKRTGPLNEIYSTQTTNGAVSNIYNFCKNMTTIIKDKIVGPNGILK